MELKGKIINFLGDSITEGAGASCEAARYTSRLKEIAGLAEIRNYGIGGTRIAKQKTVNNERYDLNDFCGRFAAMDDNADVIVVFGGSNDYGHGDADFGDFSTDRTSDTFCGALHVLMSGLIEKYPDKPIVVLTPLHRANDFLPNSHGKTLKDYVDKIREAAEYYSLPVLDLYATAGIQPCLEAHRKMYCPDGLHPNDAGNEIIARRLYSLLLSL